MSLITGLYTGLSAIRAATVGIDTAAHNISNAATPGYTRQRVGLVAATPWDSPHGPLGTGVAVQSIDRLRDHFLDARLRTTLAEFARLDVGSDLLARVEAIMGEPDSGISVELNRLWDAFEDLAIDPSDAAARRQVLGQLDTLTARIRSVSDAWSQLATDTTTRRDVTIDEVNRLLTEVAEVNRIVGQQDPRTVSNDLLDGRDVAIDRIAELIGATATRQPDGTVSLHLGGQPLVTGPDAQTLAVVAGDVTVGGAPITSALGGEIAALHVFVTDTLPAQRDDLDAFIGQLAQALNDQHAAGFRPDGTPGGPLLAFDPTDPARTVAVAVSTPAELAAAGEATTGPLDGRNAQALADLRQGGLTNAFTTLVVDLGGRVASTRRAASAAGDVAVGAQLGRQSQHGVSLDEEMVDLVRYQRQLEAASRVMTAIDQALDTLVNRVGIVGR